MKHTMLFLIFALAAQGVNAQNTPPARASASQPTPAEESAARAEMADLQRQWAELSKRMAEVSMKMGGDDPSIATRISDGAAEGIENEVPKEHVLQTVRERAIGDAGRSRMEIRRMTSGTPWWGINLAELNPDLGRYFGTDQGVLVLSTDGDALAGVKSGDVIQQVAGSKVRRPEDALRRLRNQPVDSEVAMQLLRERKAMTLSVRVPESKSLFEMMPPPAPPAPGAPPPPPPPTAAPASSAPANAANTIDANAPATIAAVTANPALLSRVVSPGAAKKGGAVGSPGLWGGRIRSVDSNADSTCYIVAATTLRNDGKPVRGDFRNDTFSACTRTALDKTQFVGGRYATFLGTVTDRTARHKGFPTIILTDATAWSRIPDMQDPPQPARQGPLPY